MTHRSFLILALIAFQLLHPDFASALSSCSGKNTMVTAAFVDIYDCWYQTVQATSDGGAIMAAIRYNSNSPRVVKVDSAGQFQWLSEQRLGSGDSSSLWYYPQAVAEQGGFVYVGGYISISGAADKAYVIKYKSLDGSYVLSAAFAKSGYNAQIYALLGSASSSVLVFGGAYCTDPDACAAWTGTIDSSTLALVEKTVSSSGTPTRAIKIVSDSTNIVFAGTVGTLLWVSVVDFSTWTMQWEKSCSSCVNSYVTSLVVISSGTTYAILDRDGNFYTVTHASGISTAVALTGSNAMTISAESGKVMIVGYDETNLRSFAYCYDVSASCKYDAGQTAGFSNVYFSAASSSTGVAWTAGYLFDYPPFNVLVKVEVVSAVLGCSTGSYTNYLNQNCYLSSSSGCFGLCATCLISSNINSCATGTSAANSEAINLFAGRCATQGYHYKSGTGCASVTQTSCHTLCGGECLTASDQTKCAHHCKGASPEPYIDSSSLAVNTCACQGTRTFSSTSLRCVYTSGCYALCSNGECGEMADGTKCIGCVTASNVVTTISGAFAVCSCASEYVLSGTTCQACSGYCDECTAPSDNTKCKACAAIVNIQKTGSVVPYTCACPANYLLVGAACLSCSVYCNGCTVPADNTKCSACAAITSIAQSGSTCACPANYILVGAACLPCSVYCNECTAAGDNTKCSACAAITSLVQSGGSPPYTCACPANYVLVGTACLPCSGYCSECTAPSDNTKCSACASITDIVRSGGSTPYTCACPVNYILVGTACLPCSGYCSECTAPTDNSKCSACAAITNIARTGSTSPYTCACPVNYILVGSACLPCSGYCSECTAPADNTKCSACALIGGIVKSGSTSPYTCACPANYVLVGSTCTACSVYCSGCTAPADNTKCSACASITSIVLSGSSPYTCACPANYILVGAACMACSTYCSECTSPADNTKCAACAAITNVVRSGSSAPYTCACPANYVRVGSACLQCSGYCNGCSAPADSTKCSACASITNIQKTGSVAPYTCACPTNYVLVGTACLQCSEYCSGCTVPSDNTKCTACAAITGVEKLGTTAPFTCDCPAGTALSGTACTTCHHFCVGCTLPLDNSHCLDCADMTNLEKLMYSPGYYTCDCKTNTTYDSESDMCVYTDGCHSLCNSKCTQQDDSSLCVDLCNPTAVALSTDIAAVFVCSCSLGTVFNGTDCTPVYHSGCHPLCGDGCVSKDNSSSCLACTTSQPNVVSNTSGYFKTCSCSTGTTLVNTICAYTSGCNEYCDTCISPANNSACLNCVPGIAPEAIIAPYSTCACPAGTAYFNATCLPLIESGGSNSSSSTTGTCHPLCAKGKCLVANDATKCVGGCTDAENVVIVKKKYEVVECGCAEGTRLNSYSECVLDIECNDPLCDDCTSTGVCLKCPSSGSGTTLSDGKCICQSAAGYVLTEQNGKSICVQKSSTASFLMQYSGYCFYS